MFSDVVSGVFLMFFNEFSVLDVFSVFCFEYGKPHQTISRHIWSKPILQPITTDYQVPTTSRLRHLVKT